MAKFTVRGMEEYEKKLSKMVADTEMVGGKAVHAAAGLVADEIRKNIQALPERKGYVSSSNPTTGVTKAGKKGLLEGFGISTMQNEKGYLHVKLGFDGYNGTKTKKYPNGQPNQLVARGTESGTSWLKKTPFIHPAVNQTRVAAVKAMQDVIDEEIEKTMK